MQNLQIVLLKGSVQAKRSVQFSWNWILMYVRWASWDLHANQIERTWFSENVVIMLRTILNILFILFCSATEEWPLTKLEFFERICIASRHNYSKQPMWIILINYVPTSHHFVLFPSKKENFIDIIEKKRSRKRYCTY